MSNPSSPKKKAVTKTKTASPLKEMGIFEHIDELRGRLFRVCVVFVAGFGVSWAFFTEPIMGFLRQPLFEIMPPDQQKLYFTDLFENFFTHLKIAGYSSVFLLSPYIFYELWAFVSPGLYPKERKLALPFIFSATLCFLLGAGFAYFVLFPIAFKYFIQFGAATDTPLLTIANYYGTALKFMLLFGLSFELPVLIVLLGWIGLIDAPFLRKNRSSIIIGITVLCALFAPPDAISMLMMMAPLIVLFEASIFVVAALGARNSERNEARDSAANEAPVKKDAQSHNPHSGVPRSEE